MSDTEMSSDSETLRRAWEYHKAADELSHQRTSFALVAQSMLVVSFVTVSVRDQSFKSFVLQMIICGAGLSFSKFMYLRIKSLVDRMDGMKKSYLIPLDPVYRVYMGFAQESRGGAFVLPIILTRLWAVFMLTSFIFFLSSCFPGALEVAIDIARHWLCRLSRDC